MNENIIVIPFGYDAGKASGVNITNDADKRLEIYLKNAMVAILSACDNSGGSKCILCNEFEGRDASRMVCSAHSF